MIQHTTGRSKGNNIKHQRVFQSPSGKIKIILKFKKKNKKQKHKKKKIKKKEKKKKEKKKSPLR